MFKRMIPWSLLLVCLLGGCGRQIFYFPASTGASVAYQQVRQQQAGHVSTSSPADGEAGPALASLEGGSIEKHPPLPEALALAKHLSGEIKGELKAAGAPHHPVTVGEKKSGQDKKLPYKQKKPTKLGKAGLVVSLAGLAFLLLATALPIFVFPGFLAALLGMAISIIALRDFTRGPKDLKDRRKAKAGLILGVITVVASLVLFLNTYEW